MFYYKGIIILNIKFHKSRQYNFLKKEKKQMNELKCVFLKGSISFHKTLN